MSPDSRHCARSPPQAERRSAAISCLDSPRHDGLVCCGVHHANGKPLAPAQKKAGTTLDSVYPGFTDRFAVALTGGWRRSAVEHVINQIDQIGNVDGRCTAAIHVTFIKTWRCRSSAEHEVDQVYQIANIDRRAAA